MNVFIFRGCHGSGKSTIVTTLQHLNSQKVVVIDTSLKGTDPFAEYAMQIVYRVPVIAVDAGVDDLIDYDKYRALAKSNGYDFKIFTANGSHLDDLTKVLN